MARSPDMEHHIVLAFLSLLILCRGVAIADRNPGENNVADNIPAETKLPTGNHVTEEGLAVAIQSVIQAMEDKFTRLAQEMNEMREELRKDIEEGATRNEEGQTQLLEDVQSAEERIKEEIKARVDTLTSTVTRDHEALGKKVDNTTCPVASYGHERGEFLHNCAEIKNQGNTRSGVYSVSLLDGRNIQVYCDMTTDGGGWTVIQRRADITPRVDFNRGWSYYQKGFGDLQGEFWLGLDNIHALTNPPSTPVRLRVDLEDWNNLEAHAEYDTFVVSSESDLYRLSVGGYNQHGGAGNSLEYHNGRSFTTIDRDNDDWTGGNLADQYGGGWWHLASTWAALNGYSGRVDTAKSVHWWTWKNYYANLRKSETKIRPK